jgi:mono/diheme cytochrome c family protein
VLDPMERQPKVKPFRASRLFDDERGMRPLPEGVVPRERDLSLATPPLTAETLELGHAKFDQICGACHGLVGDGQSEVALKMSIKPPPSLHDPRIRAMSTPDIYRTITEGYGLMPRVTAQLDARERWAVAWYVRALQLSQWAPVDDLPADLRAQLEAQP